MDRTYRAEVVRVVDGDTVVLSVDLGFEVWLHAQAFRLAGCNAIEHNQPGGAEATAHLQQLLPTGLRVVITSVKPDKFGGRYDALIALPEGGDLTASLVAQGWAAAWNGRGAKPVPSWPREVGT